MSLEKKKIELELMRVRTARMELDMRIEERKEEIERLAEHIIVQEKREEELQAKLKELTSNKA